MAGRQKAALTRVSIKLPFMQADWEADDAENQVLRDLVDTIRTRRAFEMNRGWVHEEPDFFLKSILEARNDLRAFLKRLPVTSNAANSRLLVLSVIDALGEILDAWSLGVVMTAGRKLRYDDMPLLGRFSVMEQAWPKIEEVRKRLESIADNLESALGL